MERSSRAKCQVLILKVSSRCNLNCTYCYMYNAGDKTYLHQPKHMSDKLVDAIITKVFAHCLKHDLKQFKFIFHGGEPLLLSKDFYRNFVTKANQTFQPRVKCHFSIQTNGTLLTDEWCKVLAELNISLGISLDGTPGANNRFRVDHKRKGAYRSIRKGLRIAQQSKYLKRSPVVLCVIDVTSAPKEVYEHYKSLGVKKINFLFPHSTYDFLPQGMEDVNQTNYGDWLVTMFDLWFEDDASRPTIWLFRQLIELILGIDKGFDYFGRRNLEFLVVETDGSIEATGALKVCGDGFTKAGVNILDHTLDEALNTDLARLYYLSHQVLPDTCQKCALAEICGGGFLPHRYSKSNGFNNPSLFCKDLIKLIAHIQNKLVDLLPFKIKEEVNLEKISYEAIVKQQGMIAD